MVLAVSTPALAGTGTSASRSGVSGTGKITFTSGTHAYPVSESVTDTSCNSTAVYVRWVVYYDVGGVAFRTEQRRNSNGCNTTVSWSGLFINLNDGLGGVRLEVCQDTFGSDECALGSYIDNPKI